MSSRYTVLRTEYTEREALPRGKHVLNNLSTTINSIESLPVCSWGNVIPFHKSDNSCSFIYFQIMLNQCNRKINWERWEKIAFQERTHFLLYSLRITKLILNYEKFSNKFYIITCGLLSPQLLSFPGDVGQSQESKMLKKIVNWSWQTWDRQSGPGSRTPRQRDSAKRHGICQTAAVQDKQPVLCVPLKFITVASAFAQVPTPLPATNQGSTQEALWWVWGNWILERICFLVKTSDYQEYQLEGREDVHTEMWRLVLFHICVSTRTK